jgi:hypothetical protein
MEYENYDELRAALLSGAINAMEFASLARAMGISESDITDTVINYVPRQGVFEKPIDLSEFDRRQLEFEGRPALEPIKMVASAEGGVGDELGGAQRFPSLSEQYALQQGGTPTAKATSMADKFGGISELQSDPYPEGWTVEDVQGWERAMQEHPLQFSRFLEGQMPGGMPVTGGIRQAAYNVFSPVMGEGSFLPAFEAGQPVLDKTDPQYVHPFTSFLERRGSLRPFSRAELAQQLSDIVAAREADPTWLAAGGPGTTRALGLRGLGKDDELGGRLDPQEDLALFTKFLQSTASPYLSKAMQAGARDIYRRQQLADPGGDFLSSVRGYFQ